MNNIKIVLEALEDLRGYSGVGEDGNPLDTRSWNAALVAAKEVIVSRMEIDKGTDVVNEERC